MQQHATQTQPTPQQVFEEAYKLLRVGDVYEAAKRASKLRMHFPEDVPILTLHGLVLARMGLHPQALSDLIKAARLTELALGDENDENPARPRIVDQLIRLSVQICRSSIAIGEFRAAHEAIERALEWDPERGDAVGAKAELLAGEGEAGKALELIEKAEKDKLDAMPIVLAKARIVSAMEAPDQEALAGVASELGSQSQVSGQGVLELGDLLRAQGLALHRLGRSDEAFNAYRRAAKLRRGSYDPRAYTMMTTRLIHDWTAQDIGKLQRPQQSGEKFVLLLGAPGSGARELGELLNQLPGAEVLGPIETLSSVCIKHLGARQGVLRPAPFEPVKLRGAQLKEAAADFARMLSPLIPESARRVIDTHPLNAPLAGAAAAFLPGINIVMCRRDPIESTLACYCDAMVGNHPYAGDLLNAAAFVADTNRLMEHWKKQLGDEPVGANIVEIDYQQLAADPRGSAIRVAREIGIDAGEEAIERVPGFSAGPGDDPERYASYTKQITGLFKPA